MAYISSIENAEAKCVHILNSKNISQKGISNRLHLSVVLSVIQRQLLLPPNLASTETGKHFIVLIL